MQAGDDANLGMVAYEMNLTVQRVGDYISATPRHGNPAPARRLP